MNRITELSLKASRKLFNKLLSVKPLSKPECIQDVDEVSEIIYNLLDSDKPCMIARFGSNELNCLVNYLGVKEGKINIITYILGKTPQWWWSSGIVENLHVVAGFFPPTEENLARFSELLLMDMKEVDILGSWIPNERHFENQLSNVIKIRNRFLEPFWSEIPWTRVLGGKRILVVHPFAESIREQYNKKELLFSDPNILPQFELITMKAVLSHNGENHGFKDWFAALKYMEDEIDKIDYDICLLGCGAYGFHLAAHIKRNGKKAVHLGGVLQLLFGIRGKRWENPNYAPESKKLCKKIDYLGLVNEYWIRPADNEKPQNANKVEGATYW